ncbi:MAG: type 4a pilus biogenesis protein PilO [Fibrobacterales bacterium]
MNRLIQFKAPIIFFTTALTLFVGVWFVLIPVTALLLNTAFEKQVMTTQLDGIEDRIGYADSLLQHNYIIWDKIQSVKKSVPTTGKSSYILDRLLENARNKQLKITDIFSLSTIEHQDFIEHPFELKLEGYFKLLHEYLAGLENLDMVVNIKKIHLGAEDIHKPKIVAEVQLSVYILKESENSVIYNPEEELEDSVIIVTDSIIVDSISSKGETHE